MKKGTIKWYNPAKGYGFITPEDGGSDVFLHATALERANINFIADQQLVSYEIATNKGKTSAVNISLINDKQENEAPEPALNPA